MNSIIGTLAIGIAATAFIDLWGQIRHRWLGIPNPDYGLVGRWIGTMPTGRFRHDNIKAAPAVTAERWIGWCAHYLIGIAFATTLVLLVGRDWLQQPDLAPALVFGAATVVAPYFLMQPGMGLGIAAAKTAKPTSARLHSLLTHLLFGLGLYISAVLMNPVISTNHL